MQIIKLIGPEIEIDTANTVSNSTLVRVINTGTAASLNVGPTYSITVGNLETVVVEKKSTDELTGPNMLAVPVAYKN